MRINVQAKTLVQIQQYSVLCISVLRRPGSGVSRNARERATSVESYLVWRARSSFGGTNFGVAVALRSFPVGRTCSGLRKSSYVRSPRWCVGLPEFDLARPVLKHGSRRLNCARAIGFHLHRRNECKRLDPFLGAPLTCALYALR